MKWISKKKIPSFILLDDDSWALAFAKEIIQGYNRHAEVITFSAAKDAIEYMEAEDFMANGKDTVFLTDLHMPEIDGIALLDRMQSRFNAKRDRLHIFVLSAAACPEEIIRVSSYSCVIGFLNKPFSRDKMKQIAECIMY
ncbi:MAG TPA: response regulator [Puia sp.]|nr:response regulator [Puia sp.]